MGPIAASPEDQAQRLAAVLVNDMSTITAGRVEAELGRSRSPGPGLNPGTKRSNSDRFVPELRPSGEPTGDARDCRGACAGNEPQGRVRPVIGEWYRVPDVLADPRKKGAGISFRRRALEQGALGQETGMVSCTCDDEGGPASSSSGMQDAVVAVTVTT